MLLSEAVTACGKGAFGSEVLEYREVRDGDKEKCEELVFSIVFWDCDFCSGACAIILTRTELVCGGLHGRLDLELSHPTLTGAPTIQVV